jgi:prepilin-type N-terminal cleavage/methylation domain-containing protein
MLTLRRGPKKAFTLLELIVVIVILGLLAALAIPTFARVTKRSQDASTSATLSAVLRDARALRAFDPSSTEDWKAVTETAVKETAAPSASGLLAAALEVKPESFGEPTRTTAVYSLLDGGVVLSMRSASGNVCLASASLTSATTPTCAPAFADGKSSAGAVAAGSALSDGSSAPLAPGTSKAGSSGSGTPSTGTPVSARSSLLSSSGPLWWYRFDDATGSTSAASSVAGTPAAVGTGSFAFGAAGTGSSSKSVAVGATTYGRFQAPAFDPLGRGAFTVESWVRPSVADAAWRPIFTNENASGSTADGRPRLQIASYAGKYYCERVTNAGATSINGGAALAGVAANVACTYNGSDLVLYVNGSEVSRGVSTFANDTATSKSFVGASNNNPGVVFFKGSIEDVATYYRALSASEVLNLASATN